MKKTLGVFVLIMTIFNVVYGQNILPDTGNVGIGTRSPVSLLHISSTSTTILPVTISNMSQSNSSTGISLNGTIFNIPMATIRTYFRDGIGGGGDASSELTLLVPGMNTSLNIGNGTLGVNTNIPVSQLSNIPNTTSYPTGFADANGLGISGSGLTWLTSGSGYTAAFFNPQTGPYVGGLLVNTISTDPGSYIAKFESGGKTRFVIRADGGMGIGTLVVPTGFALAVNGSVISTSVTVQPMGNWPDYVFKKDYELLSLRSVKNYVDQNHHLPELPSEQEVEKNGLNLGEMNKLLLKKVEELTLYLIEKDRQIEDQRLKSKLQDERIQNLEDQLQQIYIIIKSKVK